MKKSKVRIALILACLVLGIVNRTSAMGLRTFVALPVDKEGKVIRLTAEHVEDTDKLTISTAYGINADQTLLLGLPFRLSQSGSHRLGDVSVLYRHLVWKEDRLSGTNRLGLLGGIIIPADDNRDFAAQAGFVITHVKNRHEIDIDVLYQAGIDNRPESARYDLSWQYRLFPAEYPDWGLAQEWYSVLELNGRWREGNSLTHQVTAGLQCVHKKWVIEGGVVKDINNENEWHFILSSRFHF